MSAKAGIYQYAEGMHICGGGNGTTFKLLRCRIVRRPRTYGPSVGNGYGGARMAWCIRSPLKESKVDNHGSPISPPKDVLWLDVAMDESSTVQMPGGGADFQQERGYRTISTWQWTRIKHLHGDKRASVRLA